MAVIPGIVKRGEGITELLLLPIAIYSRHFGFHIFFTTAFLRDAHYFTAGLDFFSFCT